MREKIVALKTTFIARTEWPTSLLIMLIHGGWLAVARCVHTGVLYAARNGGFVSQGRKSGTAQALFRA
jgi:hypothetical protein